MAKGDPPGWLADEPAARQTLDGGAGLVMFSGDKLSGTAGWDHRRRRRTRAEVRRTSVGPGASARFARAGRSAGNGARLSGRGRRRDPVLAHGLAHRRPTPRAGRCLRSRRDRRRHVHARRRHPSRRGDPLGRCRGRRRPARGAARTRPPDHRPSRPWRQLRRRDDRARSAHDPSRRRRGRRRRLRSLPSAT